jgi:lipopolysaccharide/colanic/teichoic acid biosynthesis glycosyltransferase
MVPNADQVLRELLERDAEARAEFEANWKLQHDPRITPLGRVLRKTSLDELPQLVNVLKGEMALVGPRPVVTAELPKYGHHAEEVLSVRPGVTGLWQVSGRNDVTYDERVQLDVAYVRRSSLLFDLGIIARTAMQVAVPFKNGAC